MSPRTSGMHNKTVESLNLQMASKNEIICVVVTITSKINIINKGVYFLISKLHSILAVANLLAHNNKSQICYCSQISLQSDAVNCSFSDNLTPLWVTLILLAIVATWQINRATILDPRVGGRLKFVKKNKDI